jgi:hypothetical protein
LLADQVTSMNSKALAFLLVVLGITKTRNHAHVSDDNPHLESQSAP